MTSQRTDRKYILSVGTVGLILALLGASTDSCLDDVQLGLIIFGIVESALGLMMTVIFIVKESTFLNSITCLDSRILRKGINILISLLIYTIKKVDIASEDEKYKIGWSWGLMFIGGLIILTTGGVDLCKNYCIFDSGNDVVDSGNDVVDSGNDVDDSGNDVDDSENDVDDSGNDVDDSENDGIEMEEMVNDRDRAIGR